MHIVEKVYDEIYTNFLKSGERKIDLALYSPVLESVRANCWDQFNKKDCVPLITCVG